jgi:hypothetical protein
MDFSYSMDITNKYIYDNLKKEGKRIVFAVWHCFFYSFVFTHKFLDITVIVSQSKDGDLGAFLLKKYGFLPIRGSSSKGGKRALLQTKRYIDKGYDTAITVDGPRGPRFDVKPGAIYLAKMSDLIILPVIFNIGPHKAFNSWDKFIVPLPFTHISVIYGDPLIVTSSKEKNEIFEEQYLLKKEMMNLTIKHAKYIF